MKYSHAKEIADRLVLDLHEHCERIEIAGSLRRLKPIVRDIEICVIPKRTTDLFGNPVGEGSLLDTYTWSKWGKLMKAGSRYKQIDLNEGIKLDLFLILPPANWGVIYTLRTGPEEFSKWIVTTRRHGGCLPSDCRVRDGGVYRHDQLIPMPEEQDFLDFLGLGWIEPPKREVTSLVDTTYFLLGVR